jgi:hypothetical protein
MCINALNSYAEDMSDPAIVFTLIDQKLGINRPVWFGFAIYYQWTQLFALTDYISKKSSEFDEERKEILMSILSALDSALYQWHEWEGKIGKLSDQKLFAKRLANIEIRRHASSNIRSVARFMIEALAGIETFLEYNDKKNEKEEGTTGSVIQDRDSLLLP